MSVFFFHLYCVIDCNSAKKNGKVEPTGGKISEWKQYLW